MRRRVAACFEPATSRSRSTVSSSLQPESVLPASGPRTEDPTLRALRQWVANRLGLRFDYQRSDFRARIEAFCRTVHHAPEELLDKLLAEDPEMVARVAEIISTNHTSFYREPEAFTVFQETVLPSLPLGPLRIGSAAASSGEEAYTIAFCVRDALGADAADGHDVADGGGECGDCLQLLRVAQVGCCFLLEHDGRWRLRW